MATLNENTLSKTIIGCAIEVHRQLGGPGLLESAYEEALACELTMQGLLVERQVHVPIRYKGQLLETPLRLDLLVEHIVIVECKAVEEFNPVYCAQALTYLRMTGLKLALVINFGESMARDGLHRIVNHLNEQADVSANGY